MGATHPLKYGMFRIDVISIASLKLLNRVPPVLWNGANLDTLCVFLKVSCLINKRLMPY